MERPFASAGATVSAVGGLVLLSSFWQIGAMPDLDLASASAVLMAVAIVGVLICLSVGGCAVLAGLACRDFRQLIEGDRQWLKTWLLVAPGAAAVLVSAAAVTFDILPIARFVVWLPFALGLPCAIPLAVLNSDIAWGWTARLIGCLWLQALWALMAAMVSVVWLFVLPRDPSLVHVYVVWIAWAAWCTFCNWAILFASRAKVMEGSAVIAALSAAMLAFASVNAAGWTKAALSTLAFGEFPARLVVTEQGCHLLNSVVGAERPVCEVKPQDSFAIVCPVWVRSRLGSPYFLSITGYDAAGRWPDLRAQKRFRTIALPKTEVLSWAILEPMAAPASVTLRTTSPATHLNPTDTTPWLRQQCGPLPSTL